MDNNSNRRSTRAMEAARIQAIIAENRAATANETTSTAGSASSATPSAPLAPTSAPSSSSATTATIASSTSDEPTTIIVPSTVKKSKAPVKPSTSKAITKTSDESSTSKSAGKKKVVYNPDIDEETEENMFVRKPLTTTTSSSGPTDDDNRARARNNPKPPTIKIRPRKKVSTPEQQAAADIARLALHEGHENAAPAQLVVASSHSVMSPDQRPEEDHGHPACPDLPPEIPRDEEGIPTSYYSRVDGKTQVWRAKK